MKISSLDVSNFRSFRHQSWQPGDVNLLIGPNASGKSNLLKVLELLSHSARGGLSRHIQREGGMDSVCWEGSDEGIGCRFAADERATPRSVDFEYTFTIDRVGRTGSYRIESERLQCDVGNVSLVVQQEVNRGIIFFRQQDQPEVTVSTTSERKLPEYESLLSTFDSPVEATESVSGFQHYLASWQIYHTIDTSRDSKLRSPQVTRHETQVDPDGQNLVCVLHTLYSSSRDFEREINAAMRAAFGEEFEKLVFPPAADQRIQMRIRWRSNQRETPVADLSDGTLRFLFLMAVLANPNPAPLIAIDEPETGLHPSMFAIIAEYAREAARKSQVIFTTHSPSFLDAFGDEPPTTTVVERVGGESVLRTIAGDELTKWLKSYSLGELFRSGELEAQP